MTSKVSKLRGGRWVHIYLIKGEGEGASLMSVSLYLINKPSGTIKKAFIRINLCIKFEGNEIIVHEKILYLTKG